MTGIDMKKCAVEWGRRLGAYKYVLIVIVAGLLLLVWPSKEGTVPEETAAETEVFSLETMEKKLEDALGCIEGVGEVTVSLTVKSGMEYVLAQDSDRQEGEEILETVIISAGSGVQEVVVQNTIYPTYQGALVVCQGGDDPEIKLQITRAVSSLTGLGSARITVCKGENFS